MRVGKGKSGKPGDKHSDFVAAVFARDAKEAQSYRELLSDHEIPAICGLDAALEEDDESKTKARRTSMTHGVPVLVPEDLLDEASEVIADRENLTELGLDEMEEDDEDEEDGELDYTTQPEQDMEEEFDEEDDEEFPDDADDLEEDDDSEFDSDQPRN